MDWSDERYVRLYTRDTATWKLIRWEGQTVLMHLLRKVDRAGVFEFGPESAEEALVAMTGLPLEIVATGLRRLLDRGSVIQTEGALVLPKFIEAQEANQTDAQRQREYRARRRDLASKKKLDEGRLNEPERMSVYFLRSTQTQDIKIGISSRVARRVMELQNAHGAAIEVLVQFESTSAAALEAELHARFEKYRKPFGEWFLPATEIMGIAQGYAKSPGASGALCGAPVTKRDDVTNEPPVSRNVMPDPVTHRDVAPSRGVTGDGASVTPRSHDTLDSEQNVTLSLAVPSLAVPTRDRSGNRSSKTASSSQAEASPAGAREAPAPAAASEQGLPARPVRKSALVSKPVDSAGYQPMPEHETYAVAMGLTPDEYRAVLAEMVGKFAARGYAPLERWDTRLAGFVDSAALNKKSRPKARAAPTPQPKIGFGGALSRSFFGSQLDDDDEEVKQA